MGKTRFLLAILLFLTTIAGQSAGTVNVTVSIPPQKYFVENIGGDHVKVNVMLPPGAFPGTYEPKPRQMILLNDSEIFFSIGVPYEKAWLEKFRSVNPGMNICPVDEGIEKIPISGVHHHEHEGHAGEEKHDESSPDPHIWLSPEKALIMAKNIRDCLVQSDPGNGKIYEDNYRELSERIKSLDKDLQKMFENVKDGRFIVFHPSWGYFAEEYGLEQIPIEVKGREPGPKDMEELISVAEKYNLNTVFIQPQVSPKTARVIAKAIGGKVVTIDPLDSDWELNLRKVAVKLKRSMTEKKK